MNSKLKSFANVHPGVLMAYFLSIIVVAMFTTNPVMLTIALFGGVAFFGVMKNAKEFFKDLMFYIPMFFLITIINPLFSHNGVTPLFFMNGNPVTLEAILYGANIALMLIAVIYWCKCFSLIMTTDKFMYLFGKAVPKLALLMSMALRFIPLFKNNYREIREVQGSLGQYSDTSAVGKASTELKVFSSLMTWALENSVDTGASMRARGYGLKGRSHFSLFVFRKKDFAYLLSIIILFLVVITGLWFGAVDFVFYPEISEINFGIEQIIVYSAFAILSFIPFISEIWEVIMWKYSVSKI